MTGHSSQPPRHLPAADAALAGAVALIARDGAVTRRSAPAASSRRRHPPAPQQPSDISTTISSDEAGAPPRFAVPDFIALHRNDAEMPVDAPRPSRKVLWDDLNFEREFALIPRDIYATIPAATSFDDVPFDRWRELNADGVVVGTVQKTDAGVRVEVRLFNVRSAAVGVRAGIQRLGRQPAALRAHDRPTRSTSSSGRCAAWRAPSWPSTRIATASGWPAPSRAAASRRSTSPTTTARTSGG